MDVNQLTKITLALELADQGVCRSHIAEKVGIGRATLYRWLDGVQEAGDLELFVDRYLSAKKGPRKKRKVDGILKLRVWNLRDRYDCCGQKIQYFLKEEYGTELSVTEIYAILKEKYKLRSKWKKNQKRGHTPKALKPREVIQMDTVDFGDIYAFTGVDIFSKEVDVYLAPALHYMDLCFSNRQWRDGLMDFLKPSKPMGDMNSKVSLSTMSCSTPKDTELLILTERMNNPTSKVLTDPYGKNV